MKPKAFTFFLSIMICVAALMPFFAHYGVGEASASNLFGDKILICSSEGYKWIDASELDDEDVANSQNGGQKCPICSAHANNIHPTSASPYVLANPVEYSLKSFVEINDLQGSLVKYRPFASRAPPQFS